MAKDAATATSLDWLRSAGAVVAAFHPGKTAAGHHWTLSDQEGTVHLRTRRVHKGGRLARAAFQAATLTGMDNGNDIHLEILGADDLVLASASTLNAKPPTVSVTGDPGGAIADTVREANLLTVRAGGSEIASVTTDGDEAWPVLGPGGERLGELLPGDAGPSTNPSFQEIVFPYAPNMSSDFARTMHLGVRRVMRYSLLPAAGGPAPSVALGLLPLLAGLSY